MKIVALYADGGLVGAYPRSLGGTWAWCHVNRYDEIYNCDSGFLENTDDCIITNNVAELYAVVRGMEQLPNGWSGVVASDSQATIGRLFCGWQLNGVPEWLVVSMHEQLARLDVPSIMPLCLDGHPTQGELRKGYSKRGNPVSEFNVWCDQQCGLEAVRAKRKVA